MGIPYRAELAALLCPASAFGSPPPLLGRALGQMLILWVPPALAHAALGLMGALRAYASLRTLGPPGWATWLGADPEGLREVLRSLPPPPPFAELWPWLLVLVPLGLLGTWLHHAVWDHAALWMLGGVKADLGFRASLLAEAQALRAAAAGTVVGLLGFLPGLGLVLAIPLLLLDGYLWIFRGFALAARHGCELWRGLAATVVHAVLLGFCAMGLGVMMWLLVRMGS